MATMTQGRTEWLNRLIRGELSAIETYRQALDKMKDAPEATELQSILTEHRGAVQVLQDHVRQRGGIPATDSGAWGTWAKLVEGSAKVFGNAAALKALKEGEEHGIKEYERAVEATDIDDECREMIRTRLLAQAKSHIPILDRLIDFQ
jgi:uncharacterized protein (TIGR02284 family)